MAKDEGLEEEVGDGEAEQLSGNRGDEMVMVVDGVGFTAGSR